MSDDISVSLATIESALRRLGREALLQSLQSGLPADAVRSALDSTGLPSTSELEEVYAWRNGTASDSPASLDDIQLFPGFHLLSLEDAVTNYRTFVTGERWTPRWLPVFANGGGDFYVVDLSPTGAGAVRHFWIDEAEHPIEFSSLSAMMATLAQGFARGIFTVDPDGYLEMDDLVFGELATETNPDVAYWRELT
ncbi:MAG TPA: SMI1/KNR4 family protein [Kribbella sp.]|jgi:hypothetical protein